MRFFFPLIFVFLFAHNAAADVRFLSISDIHYGSKNTTGDGQDTGNKLLDLSLHKLKQLAEHVDFIITLGDFPTHMLFVSSKKEAYIATVFHALFLANHAKIPLFYIAGNNDSLGGNYQPFSSNGKSPLNLASDWQGACAYCKGLIIDDKNMRTEGYYATYVLRGNKNILLIALNATQFTRLPMILPRYPDQQQDATAQLNWLDSQLKTHHAKQLLIAMHEPPGIDYKGRNNWHEAYLKRFLDILDSNKQNYGQISLLTAHTHMDDIRKISLPDGKNLYAFGTPSVSRSHHNYPGMKIFTINNASKLVNYRTYYTSKDNVWDNEYYDAIGSKSVFPMCHKGPLSDCLNSISDETVCQRLQFGFYYGVKNPKVDSSMCVKIYLVHTNL